MDLVSMKYTPAEQAEEKAEMAKPYEGDQYPYGLCLDLNAETMEKLGMTELPAVGTTVNIVAQGKITRVSESASENNENKSASIQITDLGVEKQGDTRTPGERMYG